MASDNPIAAIAKQPVAKYVLLGGAALVAVWALAGRAGGNTERLVASGIDPQIVAAQTQLQIAQAQERASMRSLEAQLIADTAENVTDIRLAELSAGLQRYSLELQTQLGSQQLVAGQAVALAGLDVDRFSLEAERDVEIAREAFAYKSTQALITGQVDIAGIQGGTATAQAREARRASQTASITGAIGSIASAVGAFFMFSDARLKSGIRPVMPRGDGIMICDYEIFGKAQRGVIAQEMLFSIPESVGMIGPWYAVNYGAI